MSKLEETCREYLASKNATLLNCVFNLKDEKGLDEASEWLARHMRGVIALRQEQNEEPLPEYKGEDIDVEPDDYTNVRVWKRYFNRLSAA